MPDKATNSYLFNIGQFITDVTICINVNTKLKEGMEERKCLVCCFKYLLKEGRKWFI